MHAVSARDFAVFIEEHREPILSLLNLRLAFEQSFEFLCINHHDGRVALREFVVSRLKLSQLVRAVRSPGAANENDDERFSAIAGKLHDGAVCGGQREIGRCIAHLESVGICFKHW